MQAAVAEEERKRQQALERQAAEKGETKWVLSVRESRSKTQGQGLRVSTAGLAEIDELDRDNDSEEGDSEEERKVTRGRMRYGKVRCGAIGVGTYPY